MARYLDRHPKGGWCYQRDVPKALHEAVGRKRWRDYHKECSERDAQTWARGLAAQQDRLIAALQSSPEAPAAFRLLADAGPMLALPELLGAVPATVSLGDAAQAQLQGLQAMAALREKVMAAGPIALEALPSSGEHSWQGLFEQWKRKTGAKHTEQHPATIRLLRSILGEMDYRRVKPEHADKFLKGMAERGVTPAMQVKHRERASGMFKQAVPLQMPHNPFAGVQVDNAPASVPYDPFTGEEVRNIFKAVVEHQFGNGRLTEVTWCLRLAEFMGCRISEAAQLQRGDVAKHAGVWCVYFRQECAVTGRKHDEKSIKTDERRRMPLHPALYDEKHPRYVGADFREYAKGEAGEFIFAAFDYGTRGRAQWLIQNGSKLVKLAGITRPNMAPNHSFRHRWNDAARNADWRQDEREDFLGQAKGINARYGGGKALELLAAKLWHVDPESDQ